MTDPLPTEARRFTPEKALTLLGALYGISGGLALLTGFVCVVHGVLGVYGVISENYLASLVIVIGGLWLLGGTFWWAVWRLLRRRRGRIFCLVKGALILPLFIPIGTALGIFTLVLLSRPEVIALFTSRDEPVP